MAYVWARIHFYILYFFSFHPCITFNCLPGHESHRNFFFFSFSIFQFSFFCTCSSVIGAVDDKRRRFTLVQMSGCTDLLSSLHHPDSGTSVHFSRFLISLPFNRLRLSLQPRRHFPVSVIKTKKKEERWWQWTQKAELSGQKREKTGKTGKTRTAEKSTKVLFFPRKEKEASRPGRDSDGYPDRRRDSGE